MYRVILLILFINLTLLFKISHKPRYKEPEIAKDRKELIVEWQKFILEAEKRHIKFTKTLYLEFSHITENNVIGLCHYGENYRTIRIDITFWNHASKEQREMLMWHENTHCLCGRDHDYSDGKPYLDESLERFFQSIYVKLNGYMEDGCPLTVMHPIILSTECAKKHKNYYINESFNRCDPW